MTKNVPAVSEEEGGEEAKEKIEVWHQFPSSVADLCFYDPLERTFIRDNAPSLKELSLRVLFHNLPQKRKANKCFQQGWLRTLEYNSSSNNCLDLDSEFSRLLPRCLGDLLLRDGPSAHCSRPGCPRVMFNAIVLVWIPCSLTHLGFPYYTSAAVQPPPERILCELGFCSSACARRDPLFRLLGHAYPWKEEANYAEFQLAE